MISLDDFLAENNMKYADFLAGETRQKLRDIWDEVQEEKGQSLSDAEMDEIIGEFVMLGEIIPADAGMNGRDRYDEVEIPQEEMSSRAGLASGSSSAVIVILKDTETEGGRHQMEGDFTNPKRRRAFEYRAPDGKIMFSEVLAYDVRFRKLLIWLGKNHTHVLLTGTVTGRGYEVDGIHILPGKTEEESKKMSDDFLQFMIDRIAASMPREEGSEVQPDRPVISDLQSIRRFIDLAGDTLPPNMYAWAKRTLLTISGENVSQDEKRHAQRALSLMLGVRWTSSTFKPIDPVKARKVLDEELFGLENVKQRIIETIIQINRAHTLPAYGLLLVGPAGTGKSQIAYAVARILQLPYAVIDMSTVRDPEALTGTPRIYTNARPGRIMEAFAASGSSNIVFVINELDKADSRSQNGSPADTLLTLLDNLGYTDNYMECAIPTAGVYTIATANEKKNISDPLISRFAVIDIPDYTKEEKKQIFSGFSLPRVLKRIGMDPEECIVTDEAVDVIVERFGDVPGCRDLEQAAELLAGNALYEIESGNGSQIVYDAERIRKLLDR